MKVPDAGLFSYMFTEEEVDNPMELVSLRLNKVSAKNLFDSSTTLNITAFSDADSTSKVVFDSDILINEEKQVDSVVISCKDYLIMLISTDEGQHTKTINCKAYEAATSMTEYFVTRMSSLVN